MHHADEPVRITAYANGPLIVRGKAQYIDEHGEPIEQPRRTAALCRCGASAIKPWCDGTHKLMGFTTGAPHSESNSDGEERGDTACPEPRPRSPASVRGGALLHRPDTDAYVKSTNP